MGSNFIQFLYLRFSRVRRLFKYDNMMTAELYSVNVGSAVVGTPALYVGYPGFTSWPESYPACFFLVGPNLGL